MATLYVDYEGGNDANDGLSFANRKKLLSAGVNAASSGDTVRVMASPTSASIGNATWTKGSATVTLATGRTANLYLDGAWTASANVTATAVTTSYKEGSNSSQLAIASGFTTGKIAYYAVAAGDLSAYQKITFWIRANANVTNVNIFNIRLCSDGIGAVAVETLTLPSQALIANSWMPITINKGSAFSSTSIQSIAIYASSDPGTVTLLLDNIVTTNDLSFTGLISKNGAGSGDGTINNVQWWGIRSINGTTLKIDKGINSSLGTNSSEYPYTTETVDTHYRECIQIAPSGTSTSAVIFDITTDGSSGNVITVSGGWNRTDMSTQTSTTAYLLPSLGGKMVQFNSATYQTWSKFILAGGSGLIGASGTNSDITFSDSGFINTGVSSFVTASTGSLRYSYSNCYFNQGGSSGIGGGYYVSTLSNLSISNVSSYGITAAPNQSNNLDNIEIYSCTQAGIYIYNNSGSKFNDITIDNVAGSGIAFFAGGLDNEFRNITISNCTTTSIEVGAASGGNVFYNLTTSASTNGAFGMTRDSTFGTYYDNYLYNSSIGDTTELYSSSDYAPGRIISIDHDQTVDNHVMFMNGGRINSDSTTRHTASGISWRLQPTSTSLITSGNPLKMKISAVAVNASTLVTAKIWARRTNTGLTGRFYIKADTLTGISTEQTASISAAADTWEELTLTFTPTRAGVVDFWFEAYGGTTYSAYVDDFSITQA